MKKLSTLLLFVLNLAHLTYGQSVTLTPNQVQRNGGSNNDIELKKYGNEIPFVLGQIASGTQSAPLNTTSGQHLMRVGGSGYVNGAFTVSRARINFMATENWTNTANGVKMTFFTTQNGAVSPSERLTIDHDGQVGIGATDPSYLLDINGRSRIRHNGNTAGIWFSKTDNVADQGSFFGNINDASAGIWIGNAWRFGVNDAGTVWVPSLAGTGTRPVGADDNGNLVPMTTTSNVAFSAYRGNTFSVTTFADLVYNIEEFDLSNNYDTGTGIFTAPVNGIYNCTATVTWQDSFTGARTINIQKLGLGWNNIKSKFIPSGQNTANTDDNTDDVSGLIQLNANDQLKVMVSQGSGSAKLVAPASNMTYFSCFKVN